MLEAISAEYDGRARRVCVAEHFGGAEEREAFMERSFYPAEALRFYRLPLSLFALAAAAIVAFLAGLAAIGVEADERYALYFLAAVDGAAILFLGLCLRQLSHRGLLLEEDHFLACGWRRRAYSYSEIGNILLLPKTISAGRGRDVPVTRNGEPVWTLLLMRHQSADRMDRWRQNLRLGSTAFQVNFGGDCIGQALYTEELV